MQPAKQPSRSPAKVQSEAESEAERDAPSDSAQRKNPVTRNWQGRWPKTPGRLFGIALIRAYQLTLSGFIGHSCRHLPTCSEYGYEAIARHGLIPGVLLTARRVARCGPFGKSGIDPVPHEWPQRR